MATAAAGTGGVARAFGLGACSGCCCGARVVGCGGVVGCFREGGRRGGHAEGAACVMENFVFVQRAAACGFLFFLFDAVMCAS